MAAGGLVIKTQDGTTYFIRDEILDACKVADDELEVTEAMVDESDDVAGFSLNFAQPVNFSANLNTSKFAALQQNKIPNLDLGCTSTVMCCW